MPIRFSGSARPRKLKSPDPADMPSVRENIVPRIKAEVAYYKDNGELPSVSGLYSNTETYFTITETPTLTRSVSGFDVYNDDLLVVANSQESKVQSFKRNQSTSEWELVTSKAVSGLGVGYVLINTEASVVFVGASSVGGYTGTVIKMDIDLVTGVIGTTNTNLPSTVTQDYIYDGTILARNNGLMISGAAGYTNGGARVGLIFFRDWDTGQTQSIQRAFTSVSGAGSGTNGLNHMSTAYDVFFGSSIIADGTDRFVVSCSPVDYSTAIKNNTYAIVFSWDGSVLTEEQKISSPGSGSGIVGVFNSDVDGTFYMVVINPDSSHDLIKYIWSDNAYSMLERVAWDIDPGIINRGTIIRTKALADGSLLMPTNDSSGRIIKVTK